MNFSKRLNLFGDEIFAALNERRLELEKQGKKIYNMSVGTPDFHTPDHIKKALMEAAADDQTGVTVSAICLSFWMRSVHITRSASMWKSHRIW